MKRTDPQGDFERLLVNDDQRRLYAYWLSRCGPDRLPARRDIDPADIPDLLSRLHLLEVHYFDGVPRFRHRLIGTALVRDLGQDLTNRWLGNGDEPETVQVLHGYAKVARTGAPDVWRSPLVDSPKLHMIFDQMALPLAADGRNVDMLIVFCVAVAWNDKAAVAYATSRLGR
ncbi:MAG: PAS domain-containing protein [Inquilinaceae bacterium]